MTRVWKRRLTSAAAAALCAQAVAAHAAIGSPPGDTRSTAVEPVACAASGVLTAGGAKCAFQGQGASVALAGMTPGGADNASHVADLMRLMAPSGTTGAGNPIAFPAITGRANTDYYFSGPLSLSRSGVIDCGGSGFRTRAVRLVFAAGVDGVVWEGPTTSADGGWSQAKLSGCGVYSLGAGQGAMSIGSGTLTKVAMFGVGAIAGGFFAPGDGVIAAGPRAQSTPTAPTSVPPGAYVANVQGQSITLADGATASADGVGYVYRLPAALADAADTTVGSNRVTITRGTTAFVPGDLIWSAAFPFGATVYTVSGRPGAQTLAITNWFQTAPQAASKSTQGGAIWRVPAGLKRRQNGYADGDYIYGFPIGFQLACSSAGGINCTGNYDSSNGLEYGIVGRWVSGNNTGASTSHANEVVNFYLADIVEGGTIGSFYSGDSSNSGSRNSATPIIGNCINQNYSLFTGMYIDQGYGNWAYCLNGPGAPPIFDQPMAGHPIDTFTRGQGTFSQGFSNGTPTPYSFSAQVAATAVTGGLYDSATGAVSLTTKTNHGVQPGARFTLWQMQGAGSFVRLNGTFTAVAGTSGTTLNFRSRPGMALTIAGGKVQQFGGTPCFNVLGSWYTFAFAKDCATTSMFGVAYQPTIDAWDVEFAARTHLFRLTGPNYAGYTGDGQQYPGFPRGFLLGQAKETHFTGATTRPTQVWHARGDYALNQTPSPGGFAGWIATAAGGASFNPTSPVANDASGNQWTFDEIISAGEPPTSSGSCAVSGQVGGSGAGAFRSRGVCSSGTVVLTFSVPAPHGWTCDAHDLTTPSDTLSETAYSNRSCTFSGSMAASDLVTFRAVGF